MKRIISILLICVLALTALLSLASCGERRGTGASVYLEERDITGRDITYVEICVKNHGKIVVALDATTAPGTVENFISLAESGFYKGLTFHRIMENFMIQGGDPEGDGTGGSGKEIEGEFGLNGHANDISHKRGTISMARSEGYNSASSQFFICNADASSSLDGKYAAFGYVVEGMSVVDSITEKTTERVAAYYGTQYMYWLYYGNGAIPEELQPKIRYIKVLDNYEP